jgi:HSP20 family molecular chaperone IbpA
MIDDTGGHGGRRNGTLAKLLDILEDVGSDGGSTSGDRWMAGRWAADRSSGDAAASTGGFGGSGSDPAELGSDAEDGPSSRVTTRETDGGALVVADLPGVDPGDVSIGIDRARNAFTLGIAGEVVGRVPADDGEWVIADASFINGILEIDLRAA